MNEIMKYINKMLDQNARVEAFKDVSSLKLYLSTGYQFFIAEVLEQKFIIVKPNSEKKAMEIIKNCSIIEEELGYKVAVWEDDISRYKIKKYIEERQAFISVGKHMYLPFVGTLLKTQIIPKHESEELKYFSPTMQLTFLWILYYGEVEITQELIMEKIKCSRIQASRILNDFVKLGLLSYKIGGKTGRKRIYNIINKRDFFADGKRYLLNPIKKKIYVSKLLNNSNFYIAGLQALSEKSMLGAPQLNILATNEMNPELKRYQIDKQEAIEEHLYEVQYMKYDFSILTEDNYIDSISLIYSLDENDERIEIAIEEMMRDYSWYED